MMDYYYLFDFISHDKSYKHRERIRDKNIGAIHSINTKMFKMKK